MQDTNHVTAENQILYIQLMECNQNQGEDTVKDPQGLHVMMINNTCQYISKEFSPCEGMDLII